VGEEAGLDIQIQDLNSCLSHTKKILPELFKIDGCREEKSGLRLCDAIVTIGKRKWLLKSQLYLKTFIYFSILGKQIAR